MKGAGDKVLEEEKNNQPDIANFSLVDIKVYLCALLTIIPIVFKALDAKCYIWVLKKNLDIPDDNDES